MAAVIPITLVGDNLGKRHLYLNNLVDETYKRGEDFDIIKNLTEKSPIDRLFKIDLASKVKNVDYIIQNLEEEDMLYVSRALKSTWLIDEKYKDIINPQYLEDFLYPQMYTTAVTKMQHWTHLHLKDESRCRQFYQHYNEKNFELAIKFLLKCSKDDIQNEFPKVVHKITPHYFKVLSEKCSQVAKIFFDSLINVNELKSQYLKKEKEYFSTLRYLLKTDADMVLDITERYFNRNSFKRFSESHTDFIMTHQKKRFLNKPELYTGLLLNMKAIASNLNNEEAKDLVLKLARDKYLTKISWFTFKTVEPLLKRVKAEERGEFKKRVFVEKNIGEEEDEWPYETPEPPSATESEFETIFDDRPAEPKFTGVAYLCSGTTFSTGHHQFQQFDMFNKPAKVHTLLDKLFDEYRFVNFEQTLFDLRKRVAAESSPQNREYMLLVLVSKSGGRPDTVASLLELLAQHCNEPPNVRAAIIRSLVKRASIWRLPETMWNQLLQFGHGLGLDGNPPVANCHEGLHAVVIRDLVLNGKCTPTVQKTFLTQFSTFSEYSLTSNERDIIKLMLPEMLIFTATETKEVMESIQCIDKLINTLKAYKIKIDTYPGFMDLFLATAEKYPTPMCHLVNRLYFEKIARKHIFRLTCKVTVSDASYFNILKHDITFLDEKKFAEHYVAKYIKTADKFLNKLAIYYAEENGIAFKFLNELKAKGSVKVLGRPLAFLLNNQLESFLLQIEARGNLESKLLASVIKANAHITRPTLNITAEEWKKVGVKHIANRFLKCPAVKIDNNIENLLKSKRTAKLALSLSKRTTYETETFVKFATLKRRVAIKLGLKLLKQYGDDANPLIWETIKSILIKNVETKPVRPYFYRRYLEVDKIPSKIKAEYVTVIYTLFKQLSLVDTTPILEHVEDLLPDINEDFMEEHIAKFLKDDFTDNYKSNDYYGVKCASQYIRILMKFVFLSKTKEIQKHRLETIVEPFLLGMEDIKKNDRRNNFSKYLYHMLLSFKYTKVILDTQYVSLLPVMERVVAWYHKWYSVEKHFDTFAQVHLHMLYFKTVRRGLELFPEVLAHDKRRKTEGVQLVGNLFGRYVSKEVTVLKTSYFDTVTEFYIHSFSNYLHTYLYHISSELLLAIITGIFEDNENSNNVLGLYLMERNHNVLNAEHLQELKRRIIDSEDKELQCFAYASFQLPTTNKKECTV